MKCLFTKAKTFKSCTISRSLIVVHLPRFWQIDGQKVVADLRIDNKKGNKSGISVALLSGEKCQVDVLLCTAASAQQWKASGGKNVAKACVHLFFTISK